MKSRTPFAASPKRPDNSTASKLVSTPSLKPCNQGVARRKEGLPRNRDVRLGGRCRNSSFFAPGAQDVISISAIPVLEMQPKHLEGVGCEISNNLQIAASLFDATSMKSRNVYGRKGDVGSHNHPIQVVECIKFILKGCPTIPTPQQSLYILRMTGSLKRRGTLPRLRNRHQPFWAGRAV